MQQILLICFATSLFVVSINCVDIPEPSFKKKVEVTNNEFRKYAKKLEKAFYSTNEKFPSEVDTKNETEYMEKVHQWIVEHPEVQTAFQEVKRNEVKILRELYKYAANPDPKISEETRKSMIRRIAQKEEYLAGAHADEFELSDLNRIMHLAKTHLETEEDQRLKVLGLQRLDNRIKLITNMLKQSAITHKSYIDLMKEHSNKPKNFTHIPYPMSHEHILQVWMHQDNMTEDSFKIDIFFELHDLNEDGALDPEELDALLISALNAQLKHSPDLDEAELETEMLRMRKFVYKEMDKNNDSMITLDEFKKYEESGRATDHDNEEWKPEPNAANESSGTPLDDYKAALEQLNNNMPDPSNVELMAEWEASRKDLENLYQEIQAQGDGAVH